MPRLPSAPFLSSVFIKGKLRYRLTFHQDGRRQFKHFTDEDAAKTYLAEIQAQLKADGANFLDLPLSIRADAVSARAILAGTGLTLSDAARLTVDSRAKREVTLADAVDEFIKSRDFRGARYRVGLRGILSKFSIAHTGRSLDSITEADIDHYLDGVASLASASTRNYNRTILSMLFTRGMAKGFCRSNVVALTRKVRQVAPPVSILSPSRCRRILEACHESILPGIVLRLFCAIRAEEVSRLDWKDITLAGADAAVTLSATVTKAGSRRIIKIPPCALSWMPKTKPDGKVLDNTHTLRKRWGDARQDAGYGPFRSHQGKPPHPAKLDPWPRNVLRHTGISYLLATSQDLASTAYAVGNSPSIIQRHYNGLASEKDAREFYKITR